MSKLSVVIAAYDEEDNAEALLRRLHAALGSMAGWDWEAIFVVEGRDRTREILERVARELGGDVRILYQEAPSGLGNAFRRGFAAVAADADLVATLDADLNHQPEELPRLVAALEERGADVLVGSRFLAGSTVLGTPVWKRLLSGVMNSLMRLLYGLRVADKTSGFRVYRAAALRSLRFDNPNFAFLPEILIGAHRAGWRIAEEPIHFVFRERGTSKLRFWTTSLSYLALLRTRLDRWSVAVLVLFAAGLAVRVVAAFPVHKFAADADCLLTGLCAFKVLRGETPVFFAGVRIGSLEPHLTAALFTLFGTSRGALALEAVIFGTLTLVPAYLFFRLALGRERGCLALGLLAVPPPAVLFWTYMPNGYPALLFCCALVLACTAWVAWREARPAAGLALGVAVGLGLWQSLLSLGVSGPALAWLAWRRRELLRQWRFPLLLIAGVALGAAPWIAFNAVWRLGSFRENFATRAATGKEVLLDNAAHLLSYKLPELVASLEPQMAANVVGAVTRTLHPVVLAIYAGAALFFLAAPLVRRRRPGTAWWAPGAWSLLVAVFIAVAALNVASEAGQSRGLSVRYVLPLALVAPAVLALFLAALWRLSRPLALAAAAAVLLFNLAGYYWPWDPVRRNWRATAALDERLARLLDRHDIEIVVGSYWAVYPMTFLTEERVLGIPCEHGHDHYGYEEKLPPQSRRVALLAWSVQEASAMAERAQLAGRVHPVGEVYGLFLPARNPPTAEPASALAHRLRVACYGPAPPP